MFAIFKNEIQLFFSSIIAYISCGVFLISTWLICWFLPGENNIFDFGFASLDSFFYWAPIVFFFLVPALTMRSFSEEYRTGTIETLYTKPLSDMQIILGKFFAAWVLLLLALLPTAIYFYTVYHLASPVGNVDTGAIMGAYIGLWCMGGVFVAIGVFASSLTTNQIVSFMLALFISIFLYMAFDSLANLSIFYAKFDAIVQQLGIAFHYQSISRGVVDSRDVVYFVSVATAFILSTHLVLQRRKW
jgi:ABC-2 type transport system permease protein